MAKILTIADRDITVTPVKVRDLPAFLAAVEPVAADLMAGDIPGALVRNAENLIVATVIGAGVERAWMDAQGADALVELAAAVIEVNADFFARRLAPLIERVAESMMAIGITTGSPGLSAPGTATAM